MEVQGAAIGFFNRASKDGSCGCGMVLKISEFHVFNLPMAGDKGRNTKAELLGLWGILYFVKLCGIESLVIFCDSLVIVKNGPKGAIIFRFCD